MTPQERNRRAGDFVRALGVWARELGLTSWEGRFVLSCRDNISFTPRQVETLRQLWRRYGDRIEELKRERMERRRARRSGEEAD